MGLPLKVDGQNADGTFDGFDDAPDIVQLYHSTAQAVAVGQVAYLADDATNGRGKSAIVAVTTDDAAMACGFFLESRAATDPAGFIPVQVSGIYDGAINTSGSQIEFGSMLGADVSVTGGVKTAANPTGLLWPFCQSLDVVASGAGATIPVGIIPKSWFKV
jgi:hypothetical protein|tara:strand:+ start:10924 stop:11406 length:483 start_codon:yes stop_codon:yes gene_type:complete